ncbi:MAG: serine/threonine-protein kinase [Phycisphaerales bacterium]
MPEAGPDETRRLIETALSLPPGERAAYLAERCPDPKRRAAVEELCTAASPSDAGRRADGSIDDSNAWWSRWAAGAGSPAGEAAGIFRIGPFRVLRVLGAGGMGTVFEAIDDRLDRRVALKAIRAEWRFDELVKARFLREARILSSLEHPNICRLYDYLEVDQGAFLVLEFVDGEPLGRAREGLSRAQRLRLAEQIARVLVAAHAAGVVHRDLKPDNVVVTPDGDAKVLDFGIARPVPRAGEASAPPSATPFDSLPDPTPASVRTASSSKTGQPASGAPGSSLLTTPGDLVGTPMYMSPEQARGAEPTPASDVYSLGLVIAELFSGERPFDATGGVRALLDKVARGERRDVQLGDRQLARLVQQLTAVAPADRPTAADAAHALARMRGRTRRRVVASLVAAALLVAAIGATKYFIDLRRERTVAVAARSDAEDLIGFMTKELRDRLAPVGRLDALGAVAERVIDYYSARDRSNLSDAERFKYAQGLSLIGEVQLARKEADLASAERAFLDADGILDDLCRRDPANGPWLKSLGAVHFWLGNIAYKRMNLDQAQAEFDAYLRIAERLVALDASNPEWQLELGYAHSNLVQLFRDRGDLVAMRRSLDASLESKRRVAALRPGDGDARRSLANGLTYLSDLRRADHDMEGAMVALDEAIELLGGLVASAPTDADARYRLAVGHIHRGELLESMARGTEALVAFRAAQDAARGLLELDPSNSPWQREMAVAHRLAGRALGKLDRPEESRLELAASRRMLAALVERDPSHQRWRVDLAETELDAATLERSHGAPTEALAALRSARSILVEVEAQSTDPQQRDDVALRVAGTFVVEGTILAARSDGGGIAEARTAWSAAIERAAAVGSPSLGSRRDDVLAQALLHLDRAEEARAVLARLAASQALSAAVSELARAKGVAIADER